MLDASTVTSALMGFGDELAVVAGVALLIGGGILVVKVGWWLVKELTNPYGSSGYNDPNHPVHR